MSSTAKIRFWIGAFVGAVAIVAALVVVIAVREGEYVEAIHEAVIENCETNGNPLRHAVQNVLREEIKQSENKELIGEIFPQIPEKRLEELIDESVARKQETIRRIAPVNCGKAYNK